MAREKATAEQIAAWEEECDRLGYPTYADIKRLTGADYYTKEPGVRYYWSLIGNNFKRIDEKGNIKIEERIYNKISEMRHTYGLKGSTFLFRTFMRNGKGSFSIAGKYTQDDRMPDYPKDGNKNDYGVYGIYQNDKLVYIGKTIRGFKQRWWEHMAIINGLQQKPQGMMLYDNIKKDDDIQFCVLFSAYESKQMLNNRDIEAIEMAFIQLYKPKFNYIGNEVPYKFS